MPHGSFSSCPAATCLRLNAVVYHSVPAGPVSLRVALQDTELPEGVRLGHVSVQGSMSGSHVAPVVALNFDAPAARLTGSASFSQTVGLPLQRRAHTFTFRNVPLGLARTTTHSLSQPYGLVPYARSAENLLPDRRAHHLARPAGHRRLNALPGLLAGRHIAHGRAFPGTNAQLGDAGEMHACLDASVTYV